MPVAIHGPLSCWSRLASAPARVAPSEVETVKRNFAKKKSVCAIWSLVPTIFDCFCSPINNAVTLGVLTVVVKGRSLVEVLRRGVWLVRCYAQYIHASRNPQRAFRLRRLAKSGAGAGACRTHFRTWWSLFVASARETSRSCFGGPKSAFRDRRKGSERCYFEMQIL